MSNKDADNLQMLGGALIVLSLCLLWCWSSKRTYDGFVPLAGDLRALDGFNPSGNMRVKSMHDLETRPTRHVLTANQLSKGSATAPRWNIDGMIASGDPSDNPSAVDGDTNAALSLGVDMDSGSNYNNLYLNSSYVNDNMRNMNSGIVVPSEILTPMKSGVPEIPECQSAGSSILQLSDYLPQYAPRDSYESISV